MRILRTSDKRFAHLKEYPFDPHYTTIKTHDNSDLRIHHIDEGPEDGPILLCIHGQPVWSYLYLRMIPFLAKAGVRVIAPDLPGYGKSDKPAAREDYSYQRQVDWMNQWLQKNDFSNVTLFGQDWGGLIGLRMVADNDARFDQVSMGNTGLPYNPDVPEDLVKKVKEFRDNPKPLTMINFLKGFINTGNSQEEYLLAFAHWQKYCWETKDLPVGIFNSMSMERRNKIEFSLEQLMDKLGLRDIYPFRSTLSRAYEAPFPNPSFKMGPRAMPRQVPIFPDRSLEAQKNAWEYFSQFEKPFLCVFAGNDRITNGGEKPFLKKVPGTKNQPHVLDIGGGHFFQWTRPKELSEVLINFVKRT